MGLDITAYSGLEKLNAKLNENEEAIDAATGATIEGKWCSLRPNSDFLPRADGIDGIYRFKARFDFRAGVYSGYSAFRESLAKLAGYPKAVTTYRGITETRHDEGAFAASGGPFWELIYFSDCEGVIGPTTSAKLARDFSEHQAKAGADEWFFERYRNWKEAFELAAKGGAVRFH